MSSGGLLQIISLGKQDVYLTHKPEITFFKKVYRQHTNFSIELIEILSEQQSDYNNILSFILQNGDAIYRCYIEIELEDLSFNDNYITNNDYIAKKNLNILNNKKLLDIELLTYNNFKNYVDLIMILYKNLHNNLNIDNININDLKNVVYTFNNENKSLLDEYINLIEYNVYNNINISKYILDITKYLTTDIDDETSISKTTIINKLKEFYDYIIYYLTYYNKNINKYNNIINNLNNSKIDFNYSSFLGHNYFEYITLEIGGNEIEKYTNDILHINQMHTINEHFMSNYLEMIGHTQELNTFNNSNKGNRKILVPLIFWFNKNPGNCLPLVALQYSTVVINVKINDIKKIICFENYEKMYLDILNIIEDFKDKDKIIINRNLIYSDYYINYNDKTITYKCLYINNTLLNLKFPELSLDEINYLLTNNGSKLNTIIDNNIINTYIDQNEYVITKNQWIKLMLNLNNKNYIYSNFYYKFASYYPYIDFNIYYSKIKNQI
jgi:hypothetical protein